MKVKGIKTQNGKKTGEAYLVLDKKGMRIEEIKNKKKIGIFGGTFDPPTWGHEAVIALALCGLDEVWVMPCYTHSFNKDMSMHHYRLEMCKVAFGDMKNVVVSDYQIKNKMAGDTLSLMRKLQKQYPKKEFHVVIGEDNARTIDKWVDYKILRQEFKFLVVGRETRHVINIKKDKQLRWLNRKPYHKFIVPVQPTFPEDCSSTKAKELITSVNDVSEIRSKLVKYIHFDVISYVERYNLYKNKHKHSTKKLKIGLDLHGVVLDNPELFAALSQVLVNADHEVHVLTGAHITKKLLKNLKRCGIIYTHLYSIADAYRNNDDVNFRYDKKGSPWLDNAVWNKAKGKYSKEHKLDLHIDDSDVYSKYFDTPFCLWKEGK